MTEPITFEDRIAEQLRAYAAPAARPPPREAVANAVEAARNVHGVQRRSWWPSRRSNSTNTYAKLIAAAAAVLVVAVAGYQFLPTQSGGSGGQPTIAPSPSPSAAQTAGVTLPIFPISPGHPERVAAGTYTLGPSFPVSTSFVVPAGWLTCANNAELLCRDGVGVVNIDIVTNVFADPCDETTLRDPSVGPTVDDLVTAISSLPWSAVTPPTDVTLDGIRGKEFEVTAPARSQCAGTDDFSAWETTIGRRATVSPGERMRLRILDVQGTRVVIAGSSSAQDLAEINAIMDSVRFGP